MGSDSHENYSGWKGWVDQRFGGCSPSLAAYFSSELRRCGLRSLQGCRILEIGFGNGEFAAWARLKGMHYSGTELIPSLVERGRSVGFDVHLAPEELVECFPAATFDIVVAFDVLEHLQLADLREVLRQAHQCLRPGGLLIARVPSGDSPFARAIQYGDITHQVVLGSSAVRQLSLEMDYVVLAVREPVFVVWDGRIRSAFRRGLVQVARILTYPIVAALFMGGGDPVLTPNLLFVLQKP